MTSDDAKKLIARRHPEFLEHQLRWKFLLDSYEGGERYRHAVYGWDRRGLPIRNLIRHKREYPDPREQQAAYGASPNVYLNTLAAQGLGGEFGVGADPYAFATDDDYELRRARTPVPTFVAEAIDDHLSRIYAREVERAGPADLAAWWDDVDGRGTKVDEWLKQTIAPALLAAGNLDLLFDHPAAPEGATIATQADALRLGVTGCVATHLLPENLLWWRLDTAGRYAECLVREWGEDDTGARVLRFRHWTATESTLYDAKGETVQTTPHPYGRPPIVRVFTGRKARLDHVGRPTYETVAERQREYYNRDSELILSDTTQAHPLLQGPEDYVQADGTVPIGPSWLLPKKKNTNGGAATYEGFDIVDFPKGSAESIRLNKQDLRDDVDRDTAMAKPAGTGGTGASVVSQSGYSKSFDDQRLNNKLSTIADWLLKAERQIAEYALLVLRNGKLAAPGLGVGGWGLAKNSPTPNPQLPSPAEAVTISYSRQFDLTGVEDLGAMMAAIQGIVSAADGLPEITAAFLQQMVRQGLPGRDDATYEAWDAEIEAQLAAKAQEAEQQAEANRAALASLGTSGSAEAGAGEEPDRGFAGTYGGVGVVGAVA